jgi:hypothetical protein
MKEREKMTKNEKWLQHLYKRTHQLRSRVGKDLTQSEYIALLRMTKEIQSNLDSK